MAAVDLEVEQGQRAGAQSAGLYHAMPETCGNWQRLARAGRSCHRPVGRADGQHNAPRKREQACSKEIAGLRARSDEVGGNHPAANRTILPSHVGRQAETPKVLHRRGGPIGSGPVESAFGQKAMPVQTARAQFGDAKRDAPLGALRKPAKNITGKTSGPHANPGAVARCGPPNNLLRFGDSMHQQNRLGLGDCGFNQPSIRTATWPPARVVEIEGHPSVSWTATGTAPDARGR